MNQQNQAVSPPPSLFSQLIIMLATSALQQMGRMPDPATGKLETSLENAQATIDILDMLSQKTKGNLDADEEKMMGDTLTSLRLNYVQAIQADPPSSTQESSSPPQAEEAPPTDPTPSTDEACAEPEIAAERSSEKEPKFQKKYD
ncbi:MAG: DUF1844 domain-containing protein [Kiritimatiellae bacterium]|nr:DUF1844 domain-containing protein [Kiritimatiellia bacterium]